MEIKIDSKLTEQFLNNLVPNRVLSSSSKDILMKEISCLNKNLLQKDQGLPDKLLSFLNKTVIEF